MSKKPPVETTSKSQQRITFGFLMITLLMLVLIGRLAYLQIIKSDEYKASAISMQTKDITISASRGDIYDCNGTILATTSDCYSLWIRPQQIADATAKGTLKYADVKNMAAELAKITSGDEEKYYDYLTSDNGLLNIAKYLTKEQAHEIQALKFIGVELSQEKKRYYPLGNFASQLLGSVNDDGQGRSGIEYQYERYLSGKAGRWVKQTDNDGNELPDGAVEYFPAEDGLNAWLTIDEAVQYYTEQAIARALEKHGAKSIECLIMNPNTGEIIASAITGGFDPNYPLKPDEKDAKKFAKMSVEQQNAYLFAKWRNGLVSDTYEPGSTFKLITSSAAIEERVVSSTDTFNCGTKFKIADTTLYCWEHRNHGVQTLRQAVGNSCNPVLAQVATKIGKTRFMKYLELFGFTEITGIDYPGESGAIIQNAIGPVELATMGFGQGISVTPIQLLTAVNAIANGGDLITPHYVSKLTNASGEVVEEFEPNVVRKVISKATATELRSIMRYVVDEGGATTAKIAGYSIGGKTGTANKVDSTSTEGYGENYISSFVGIAPAENPQISIIVVVDSSQKGIYGSAVAAPIAKEILEDVLRYLDIPSENPDAASQTQQKEYVKVPSVVGEDFTKACEIIKEAGLKYSRPNSAKGDDNFTIVDQYPKAGTKVAKDSVVYIYKD